VSVYDYITPSDQAAALGLLVNKKLGRDQVDTVPVLVVEGGSDSNLFKPLCNEDNCAVFPAGDRTLVEGLLRHLRGNPIPGCECVYLIDCDSAGKTADLATDPSLLVTQACDMEADLVRLGVAKRVAERFLPNREMAGELVDRACQIAMPLSIVRRAAKSVSVSMKRDNRQLRLHEFPSGALRTWEEQIPTAADVLDDVTRELGWSEGDKEKVAGGLASVPADFDRICLGKDAIDALYGLLIQNGNGEVRGWECDHFHKVVRQALEVSDFTNWEVGRRLFAWQLEAGLTLIPPVP
jgi:hypothetical protein